MASSEVEFLEERLALLETWLESTNDDDNNEDLIQKREEYRGLIEETILLQKKLRKTSKLLSAESSEKTLQKLSKKQDQYLCEIEEIMNYAESDVLFETAEIEPNELLGEPLETLMEQPGMEGSSSSLNFSMSDFMPKVARALQSSPSELPMGDDLHPIAENNGTSSCAKHNESMASISTGMTSLFTTSTANSNTYNYDEKTLRKKLKKVEKLLAAEEILDSNLEMSPLDAKQMKKLRKKREQYTQALQYVVNNGKSSSSSIDDKRLQDFDPLDGIPHRAKEMNAIRSAITNEEEESQSQEDSQEEIELTGDEEIEELEEFHLEQHNNPISNVRNHDCQIGLPYDRKTLKKKLKKVKRMMAATGDAQELELYKKKKKEYKMALETLSEKEAGLEISSPSRRSQNELLEAGEFAPIEVDNANLSPSQSVESHSRQVKVPSEEDEDQIEVLQKKLRKADKSIAKARKEDDPKKLKKMEKKRLEYQTTLVELLRGR